MTQPFRQALAHVLWLGGATDSGKTTAARILAERYGLQLYHYDQADVRHHQHLAETNADYRAFIAESLDERWVHPEPAYLVERSLRSFKDRFLIVIEDLLTLPKTPMILAEGSGLTPELLAPVLSNPRQAIWLVPTKGFKLASMQRRNKPSFRDQTSNPERATHNLLTRDLMLTELVKSEVQSHGYALQEVTESHSIEDVTALLEQHFRPFLQETTSSG